MEVRKRDGQVQSFDETKIKEAINKAFNACNIEMPNDVEHWIKSIRSQIKEQIVDVETIQDLVEMELMKYYPVVARTYIRYRQFRHEERLKQSQVYQSIETIVNIKDNDVTLENANMASHTPAGQMMQMASVMGKDYAIRYLVSKEAADLHSQGWIHIHDLDYYPTRTTTCLQYDLKQLFDKGFKTRHGWINAPQSITSYATLATIIFQTNQNEQHGGQSIPAFDFYMAPGVLKSFKKQLLSLVDELNVFGVISQKYALRDFDLIQSIDYNEVIYQELFSSLPNNQLNELWKHAYSKTEKETKQAMQGFICNLNTMHSRGGNQVVFSSINYGTDTSSEGRMVIKSLLEMTRQGLGHHEVPVFPIQIFKVKNGINYCEDDLELIKETIELSTEWISKQSFKAPNFDLFLEAIKTTGTSMFPNFVFLDAPFNVNDKWNQLDPERYRYEVATMGCRTRVYEDIHGEKTSIKRGNLSFTTMNLVRLAIESTLKYDDLEARIVSFHQSINRMIQTIAKQLKERYDYQKDAYSKQFPFMSDNQMWLNSNPDQDKVGECLKHGTLGIGFIGGHQAMVAMLGVGHGKSIEAQELLYSTVKMMHDQILKLKQETQLNYSLLATPAEGLSGRFVSLDQHKYGLIEGVTDRDYYVNSFHVDVKDNLSAYDKIKLEAPYHALTLGGHITYIEVDGNAKNNPHALIDLVKCMYDQGIGYGSINHPIDQCQDCLYTGYIEGNCPLCNSSSIRRMRRITGYLTGDLSSWNKAKKAEEKDRAKHL